MTVTATVAACGRIGFDPGASPSGGPSDSGADGPDVFVGSGSDVVFPNFDDCTALTLVGSGACATGALLLTPNMVNRAGAAWITQPFAVDATTRFSIAALITMTPAGGGDGAVVTVQADPRGVAALGATGASLGYAGITPSLGVELDTISNTGEVPDAHLGIDVDGSTVSTMAVADPSLATGAAFWVWLDYDGIAKSVSVYKSDSSNKPVTPLLMSSDDLTRLGSQVWIGVTASTGLSRQEHRVSTLIINTM